MSDHHKPTPLAVVLEHLADKTPVQCIHARLVELKTMIKNKPDSEREWSMQNGMLLDAAGTRMPVIFKDRMEEVPQSYKGRDIILECYVPEGKGPSGVYVFDDDYKPPQGQEWVRRVKVTKTGQISLVGGERAQGGQQRQQQAATGPQDSGRGNGTRQDTPPPNRQQTQSSQQQAPASGAKQAALEMRHFLGQCVTAYTMAHDAATAIAWGVYERHGQLTAGGGVGMLADKLFIEVARTGKIRELPVGDVTKIMAMPPRKLGDLTDMLGERVNEAAVKRAEALKAAEHTQAVQNKNDRQAAEQQQEPDTGKKWQDGLEDDDIPF